MSENRGTGIAGAMHHNSGGAPSWPCYVCGKDMPNGGIAARARPGIGVVQVCSDTCRADTAFAADAVVPKRRRR
jgi:hypothetical protein